MQAIEREVLSTYWVSILLILCFFVIVGLKMYRAEKLRAYARSFFYKGFLEIEADERDSPFSLFHVFFTLFACTMISLVLYFLLQKNQGIISIGLRDYLSVASLVFSYFIIRLILEYGLILLFNLKEMLYFFYISKRGYFYAISLWLGLLILIYVYGFQNYQLLFYGTVFLFAFRFLLILINNKKLIISKLFYFILYLCAFEIAPILVVYKLIV